MKKKLPMVRSRLIACLICSFLAFATCNLCAALADENEATLQLFRDALNNNVAPDNLKGARLEVYSHDNITLGRDNFGNYIALNIFGYQPLFNSGKGSEIAISYPYEEGETLRYSWRMRISKYFISDAPANRWWLLARWNDQPNPNIGEDPKYFKAHNPSIMLGYKQIDGLDTLFFTYGVPDVLGSCKFVVRREEWMKFSVEVLWSRGNQGHAKLYVNDSKLPICEVTGANMYSKYFEIFRVGMQRSGEINNDTTLYFGDIKAEKIAATK